MDYRDNRQRWAESHQVVHFYAGQWCTFTPALTDACRVRKNPGILARIRSFAANIMRANNVANMTDARYRNAIGGLDRLFSYHTK